MPEIILQLEYLIAPIKSTVKYVSDLRSNLWGEQKTRYSNASKMTACNILYFFY